MSSSTTQAIATRLPNDLADQIRREADRDGTTVAEVARRFIHQAISATCVADPIKQGEHDDV